MPSNKTHLSGSWLYDGSVPTGVRIVETDCAPGTGDYQDDPETAQDRPGNWYYIEWSPAGDRRSTGSSVGPFDTLAFADAYVIVTTKGTLSWCEHGPDENNRTVLLRSDHIMPLLVASCPSYRERWCDTSHSPDFEPDLIYVHLGNFAEHVMLLLNRLGECDLEKICNAIEQLHVYGDARVRQAATVGLLEAIRNIARNARSSTLPLETHLGEVSKRWWHSLDAFWNGQIPYVGADISRDAG